MARTYSKRKKVRARVGVEIMKRTSQINAIVGVRLGFGVNVKI